MQATGGARTETKWQGSPPEGSICAHTCAKWPSWFWRSGPTCGKTSHTTRTSGRAGEERHGCRETKAYVQNVVLSLA